MTAAVLIPSLVSGLWSRRRKRSGPSDLWRRHIILPFVTTFYELLTGIVETAGLDRLLSEWVVPVEARMLAVILGFIGIPSQVSSSTIYLDKGGFFLPVYISWNCVGWQSFILFAVTLATGIQEPHLRDLYGQDQEREPFWARQTSWRK